MLNRLMTIAVFVLLGLAPTYGAEVRSKSGVSITVAAHAQAALQCVVNYVESHGVRIAAMRGYGHGTVRGSLHPSGQAIDINQTARNKTRSYVPPSVSNGAADACGVVSGARWGHADNGHWNLGTQVAHRHYRTRTRVVSAELTAQPHDRWTPQ